jgi:hypothetical protein
MLVLSGMMVMMFLAESDWGDQMTRNICQRVRQKVY